VAWRSRCDEVGASEWRHRHEGVRDIEGTLEIAAEVVANGETLHLKDIAVFP